MLRRRKQSGLCRMVRWSLRLTSGGADRRHAEWTVCDFLAFELPHDKLYAFVGAVLGLGCPIGAFFLRSWWLAQGMRWVSITQELSLNTLFYVYMGVSTVTVCAVFGFLLGKDSEAERAQNITLRRRIDQLRLICVKDPLTRTFSHAYMMETLQLEMEAARRERSLLTVAMLDFDDFKRINDTYGHLFGDNVLMAVSETIRMNIRLKDILCRYGGEEFLILMPETDLETARQVAERVRIAVAGQRIPVSSGTAGTSANNVQITLSLGIATYTGRANEKPMDIIRRADLNLYQAKREGKNRTCISMTPPEQSRIAE